MGRVVHFEVVAKDPARAVKFYETVFGWQINKWPGPMDYWLVSTGSKESPGIDGGIVQTQGEEALSTFTIEVENVDAALEKAVANGASVAVPKMPIPGVGWLAYIKDTEGVIVGLMHNDPSAG